MSTLAEIAAAADMLPLAQKRELLQFLASRVNDASQAERSTDLSGFAGMVRLPEDPLVWQRSVRGA